MTHPALLRANPYLDPLIERLALESGLASSLEAERTGRWLVTDSGTINSQIAAFAALVAEECAQLAAHTYEGGCSCDDDSSGFDYYGENSAEAIRARFAAKETP